MVNNGTQTKRSKGMGLLSLHIVKQDGTEVVHTGNAREIAELILTIRIIKLSEDDPSIHILEMLHGENFKETVIKVQKKLETRITIGEATNPANWTIPIT